MSTNRKVKLKDMTEGNIWKKILLFSFPLLLGNIFQQLYNTVDSLVVGNCVGSDALGAVTSVSAITGTLTGFFIGLSSGASIVISHYWGAAKRNLHEKRVMNIEGLEKSVHTAVTATFWMGLLVMAAGCLLTPELLKMMNLSEAIRPYSEQYLRIYFLGIHGLMFYNIGASILRAVGDSSRPLYFLICASVINVIMDIVLVLYFQLGIAGVALATVISQWISALCTFYILFCSTEGYGLSWKKMKVDKKMLSKIILFGFPSGIQISINSFSNAFAQSYINVFGAKYTSGWGIYGRIDSFAMMPIDSLALATATFVGQNAGAGKTTRIKQGVRMLLIVSFIGIFGLSILLITFAPKLVGLFSKDMAVMECGVMFIRLNCMFDCFGGANQIYASALRGVGKSHIPMYFMLGSFVVFRQVYLFAVSRLTHSIWLVSLAYPAGWLVCSIAMAIYHSRHSDDFIWFRSKDIEKERI